METTSILITVSFEDKLSKSGGGVFQSYIGASLTPQKGFVEIVGDETPFDHTLECDGLIFEGVTRRQRNENGYFTERLFVQKSAFKRLLNETKLITVDLRGDYRKEELELREF